jgi:hypothetical protein
MVFLKCTAMSLAWSTQTYYAFLHFLVHSVAAFSMAFSCRKLFMPILLTVQPAQEPANPKRNKNGRKGLGFDGVAQRSFKRPGSLPCENSGPLILESADCFSCHVARIVIIGHLTRSLHFTVTASNEASSVVRKKQDEPVARRLPNRMGRVWRIEGRDRTGHALQ